MKAIVFRGAGGNEVVSFEERPDPGPGRGRARAFDRLEERGKLDKALLDFTA